MVSRAKVVGLGLGAAMIASAATGRAELVVRPWFVPVLGAAGLLLVVALLRARAPTSVRPAAAVLLALPIVAGLALSPARVAQIPSQAPAAGAAVEGRIGEQDNPLLAGDGGRVTLLQVVLAERAVGVTELHGREVEIEAAVADATHVSRLVMVCCAADARPVGLAVGGALPEAGTWVRIRGRLTAAGNELVLEPTSVEPIPVPGNPLL